MTDTLAPGQELEAAIKFLASLAIGLLLGLQRERTPSAKAGLRTFALVGLLGCTAGLVAEAAGSAWLIAAGLVLVGAMIIAAYRSPAEGPEADSGTTTVVALLLCYTLGVMVWHGYTRLAVALGIVATALLQFKPELHGITRRLSRNDVASILQFAVLSFVILPFLPDEGFDRYRVLNPHDIWLMVVLVSGIGIAGYLALRIVGARRSLPLVGTLGGLVSSTATAVVYARHSKAAVSMVPIAGAIVSTSSLVPLVRLGIMSAVVAPSILPWLAPVLAAGLVAGALPLVYRLRSALPSAEVSVPELENPANLNVALGFGVIYAAVLFGSAWLSEKVGSHGLYAIAIASGFVDVNAIALSSMRLLRNDMVAGEVATTAIGLAYVSAVVFKIGVVALLGGRGLLAFCAPSFAGAIAGTLLGLGVLAWT